MIRYTCKYYPSDGGCPPTTPNVHCSAPSCKIVTRDSTPDIDYNLALIDLQKALAKQDAARIDLLNRKLQAANQALEQWDELYG